MPKLHRLGEDQQGQTHYMFHCPGCKTAHQFKSPHWDWNGSLDTPTVSPSILVYPHGGDPPQPRCHSFVREGRIQFLSDCGHELAGKTVELTEWEEGNV